MKKNGFKLEMRSSILNKYVDKLFILIAVLLKLIHL